MSGLVLDRKAVQRNHLALITQRSTGSMVQALLARGVVITFLITRLGGGAVIVGAMGSLWALSGFSQLFTAWYLERPISRKKFVLWVSGVGLFLLPFLALALWAWAEEWKRLMLVVLLAAVFLRSIVSFLCIPALLDLARTLIKPGERLFVFSVRGLASALCGLAAGGVTLVLLRRFVFPVNYVALVLAAALAGLLAWGSVLLFQEGKVGSSRERRSPPADFLRTLLRLLRPGSGGHEERRFRRYVAVRHAIFVSRCAYPFLAFYAAKRFGLPDMAAGWFVLAMRAGRLMGSFTLSVVARLRRSARQVTRIALSCTLLGLAAAVLTSRWEGLLAAFFLQGVFLECFLVADPILMMEHTPPERAVLGMSLTMVALYPMRIVLPILAGLLLHSLGFAAVAGFAMASGVVAFVAAGSLRSQGDVEEQPGEEQ